MRKGFGLIILAVILAVAGILLIQLMSSPPTKELVDTIKTKNKEIDKIRDALIVYYNSNNNTLPCPASLTQPAGGGAYLAAYDAACAATVCTHGQNPVAGVVCVNDNAATPAVNVRIGGVPTRSLGLSDEYAFDEWGNRLIYAIDKSSSNGINLKTTSGTDVTGIKNIDGSNGTDGKVTAVIVSTGKNTKGGNTKSGGANANMCGNAANTEDENCGNDNSTFIMDYKSANYDDFTNYVALTSDSAIGFMHTQEGKYSLFKINSANGGISFLNTVSTANSGSWYNNFGNNTDMDIATCRNSANKKTFCIAMGDCNTGASCYGLGYWAFIANNSGFVAGAESFGTLSATSKRVNGSNPSLKCYEMTDGLFLCAVMNSMSGSPSPFTVFTVNISGSAPVVTKLYETSAVFSQGRGWGAGGFGCAKLNSTELACFAGANNGAFATFKLSTVVPYMDKKTESQYVSSTACTSGVCNNLQKFDTSGNAEHHQVNDASCLPYTNPNLNSAFCIVPVNTAFVTAASQSIALRSFIVTANPRTATNSADDMFSPYGGGSIPGPDSSTPYCPNSQWNPSNPPTYPWSYTYPFNVRKTCLLKDNALNYPEMASGNGFIASINCNDSKATGKINFTGNPVHGETITINGTPWQFVTSGGDPAAATTTIGANAAATATQLAADLNASTNPNILPATYSASSQDLIITYDVVGTVGNSFTIAGSANTTANPHYSANRGYLHDIPYCVMTNRFNNDTNGQIAIYSVDTTTGVANKVSSTSAPSAAYKLTKFPCTSINATTNTQYCIESGWQSGFANPKYSVWQITYNPTPVLTKIKDTGNWPATPASSATVKSHAIAY